MSSILRQNARRLRSSLKNNQENLRIQKQKAKKQLTNFFKGGKGIIWNTNKLANSLFSQAVNSAYNANQLTSIVNKARAYQAKLSSLVHETKNQGPGYGYPIMVLYKPPANSNNRKNLIRNVHSFKPSGNLNANLLLLNKLSNRLNAIKKFKQNIGFARFK